MSMICSALAVDTSLIERMRADEDLVQGVTSLAYKRHLDQLIERHMEQQSPAQQAAARERRLQAEAETLKRLPAHIADQVAKTLALRERASMLNVGVATSVQKDWRAARSFREPRSAQIWAMGRLSCVFRSRWPSFRVFWTAQVRNR